MLAAVDVLQHLKRWASRVGPPGWTDFLHTSRGVQTAYEARLVAALHNPPGDGSVSDQLGEESIPSWGPKSVGLEGVKGTVNDDSGNSIDTRNI